MPELSRFFGIIIRMFAEVGAPHHRPHFHAAYHDAIATFALDPIVCIGGSLPRTQQRLVEAWAEIHHAEIEIVAPYTLRLRFNDVWQKHRYEVIDRSATFTGALHQAVR